MPPPRPLIRSLCTHAPRLSKATPRATSGTTPRELPAPASGFYGLPDPVFDNTFEHRFEPSKRAPISPDSHVLDTNWTPMFFGLESLTANNDNLIETPFDIERETAGAHRAATGAEAMNPLHHLPIPFNRLSSLLRYPLITRRVVQQSGKGKQYSQYALTVVGNGAGLVGVGEGKAPFAAQAAEQAFSHAVRRMDWVDRFEERTFWTTVETKFGATRLVMRPRPVGFGLMCAPGIHQLLKAAGIKDASVKIWGSRNKINVIKAAVRVLHAGHAPLAMGNGLGGKGIRQESGCGIRGKTAVERERGRRILDARTW